MAPEPATARRRQPGLNRPTLGRCSLSKRSPAPSTSSIANLRRPARSGPSNAPPRSSAHSMQPTIAAARACRHAHRARRHRPVHRRSHHRRGPRCPRRRTWRGSRNAPPFHVDGGHELRAKLRGDCHLHTSWSDGAAPDPRHGRRSPRARPRVPRRHRPLGAPHHRPRPRRGRACAANSTRSPRSTNELAPFRVLTGLEVDILEDGSLDLSEAMLAELDVVVASVHSKFRMPSDEMTRRMVMAIASPHVDIFGHCTNRKVVGHRPRPAPSSTPRSCSPPASAVRHRGRDQLPARTPGPARRTAGAGARVGLQHRRSTPTPTARARLEWQAFGCDKADRCGVPTEHIINTWSADELIAWTTTHPSSDRQQTGAGCHTAPQPLHSPPYVEAHQEEEEQGPHVEGQPRHQAQRRPRLTSPHPDLGPLASEASGPFVVLPRGAPVAPWCAGRPAAGASNRQKTCSSLGNGPPRANRCFTACQSATRALMSRPSGGSMATVWVTNPSPIH